MALAEPTDNAETKADTGPPDQRQPAFVLTLFEFQETIDAVHQIHDEICGHAAELDRQRLSPEQLSAVKSLDPERREKFKNWIAELMSEDGHQKEESPDGDEGSDGSLTEDDKRLLREVFGDNPVAIGQAQALIQRTLMVAPSREMLLRSSLLTMAVSAFEVLPL